MGVGGEEVLMKATQKFCKGQEIERMDVMKAVGSERASLKVTFLW